MDQTPQEIAAKASRLTEPERSSYLQSVCADDPELRNRVERLIRASESVTLVSSAPNQNPLTRGSAHSTREGRWIGSYRILRDLGEGAMGTVYLAEQQNPKRKVALKVMRAGTITEDRKRRFEFEAESLARLRHPGIATIYEAGQAVIDNEDHPYFAMELVEGRLLDEYTSLLSTRARLELMARLCDAVEHAHQRGVVHRDLKPANIMVDAEGRTKVLDFGVARSLDPSSAVAELVGTLPYMSPEQLRRDPDIDIRTDVYALGIILHEILTGKRPYDLRNKTIDDAIELVERSGFTVDRTLNREVGAIIARAIAPDRESRYESAGELAQDLRAFLSGESVRAVNGSVWYRSRKFVVRNRVLVSLVAVIAFVLVVGIVGTSTQAQRAKAGWDAAEERRVVAETERARAVEERERAYASNKFLVDMLVTADPESSLGAELTVREVLDTASLTLDEELRGAPSVHATVRQALSNTYLSLGEIEAALEHAQGMLDISLEQLGDENPITADARRTLAGVYMNLNRPQEALELLNQAQPVIEAYGDPVELARIKSERARVALMLGDRDKAVDLWTQGETELTALLGPSDKETLIMMHNRGIALKELGELDAAEAVLRTVVDRRIETMGPDHPHTLIALDGLAGIIEKRGRTEEAAAMLRDVAQRRERVLGPDHFATLLSKGNLGVALIQLGQIDEAEELTREALEGHRARFGSDHPKTITLMGNLAYILEDKGDIDEAAALYAEAIETRRSSAGGVDPETWAPMNNLAMLLMSNGRAQDAAPYFEDLIGMCEAVLPPGHYYTALFRDNYAQCLHELGENERALIEIEQSNPVLRATFGESHDRTTKSDARRQAILDALGS